MKLSKAEEKAVKFLIFIVALSAFARWRKQPEKTVVETSSVVSTPSRADTANAPAGKIDPNTATVAELDRLPGVGRVTAVKITEHRPYRDLGDLAKVIGSKRALQLETRLNLRRGSLHPDSSAKKRSGSRVPPPVLTGPLNLNRATPAELESLPGVGPALASRIVARRDSLRGFRSWAEVDSVSGVGPALLKRLRAAAVLE